MNKKVLRWNFVFQYGWVITNVINSLLLFPLYIHYIKADTLGVWVATSSILSWMMLVDPGVGEVLQQNIAELRGKRQSREASNEPTLDAAEAAIEIQQDQLEIGKSIGSGFIASGIILGLSVVVGLICFFAVDTLIDKDVSKYPHLSVALLITIIATGMQLVSFTVSGINQGLHNSAHVAITSLTANFLFLIVNLVLLYMGLGVMSIALSNLIRALYINVFNFTSLLSLLKREGTALRYQVDHFKKFIRIFSFTSASKIISGISGNIDMLILARFIAPSQITLYELNRRPISQSNSLIGRHSVALMPLVSHAKGSGDKKFIINLIHKQFRIYSYVVLFAAFMFIINYKDFLILWAGNGTFMGYQVLLLIIVSSSTGLLGYFMSNMNYALGDIKTNSKYWMIRNLIYGTLVVFSAKMYGIIGTLCVGVAVSILGEFLYFSYRNYKMGYINGTVFRKTLITLSIAAGFSSIVTWSYLNFNHKFFSESMHLSRLLIGSTLFALFYIVYVLISDKELLEMATDAKDKIQGLFSQKVKAGFFRNRAREI